AICVVRRCHTRARALLTGSADARAGTCATEPARADPALALAAYRTCRAGWARTRGRTSGSAESGPGAVTDCTHHTVDATAPVETTRSGTIVDIVLAARTTKACARAVASDALN